MDPLLRELHEEGKRFSTVKEDAARIRDQFAKGNCPLWVGQLVPLTKEGKDYDGIIESIRAKPDWAETQQAFRVGRSDSSLWDVGSLSGSTHSHRCPHSAYMDTSRMSVPLGRGRRVLLDQPQIPRQQFANSANRVVGDLVGVADTTPDRSRPASPSRSAATSPRPARRRHSSRQIGRSSGYVDLQITGRTGCCSAAVADGQRRW